MKRCCQLLRLYRADCGCLKEEYGKAETAYWERNCLRDTLHTTTARVTGPGSNLGYCLSACSGRIKIKGARNMHI